jgi:hypothetical protein
MQRATLDRAASTARSAAAETVAAQLRERISGLDLQINHARETIGNMERSRFWQARKMWVALRESWPGRDARRRSGAASLVRGAD